VVVIVDDLITTGRTIQLLLEAIRAAGVAGFGSSRAWHDE
jgi:adenine/guanine phosphoribosyltransferase-like PRPP-binding protein